MQILPSLPLFRLCIIQDLNLIHFKLVNVLIVFSPCRHSSKAMLTGMYYVATNSNHGIYALPKD